MNKYFKHLALVAVAVVGFASSQAHAASVSVRLGNGVSLVYNAGHGKELRHHQVKHQHDRHHLAHCRDCRRQAARRSLQAHHRHHR